MRKCQHVKILCCLCFIISLAPFAAFGEFASWIDVTYVPVEDQVESIPLEKIDNSWSKVLILTKKNQPPDVLADLEEREQHGYRFQLEGDFNRDGKKDKALVGVYEDKMGRTGRFFLVLTEAKRGTMRKAFLQKMKGKPGFSILFLKGERVAFSTCMDCDTDAELVWTKMLYELKWSDCC